MCESTEEKPKLHLMQAQIGYVDERQDWTSALPSNIQPCFKYRIQREDALVID